MEFEVLGNELNVPKSYSFCDSFIDIIFSNAQIMKLSLDTMIPLCGVTLGLGNNSASAFYALHEAVNYHRH